MRKILLILIPFWLASCATSQATKKALNDPKLEELPVQSQRLEVPFVEQTNELCGPTALKMVFDHAQIPSDLEVLTKYTYSPSVKGSTKSDMLGAVRRLGYIPIVIRNLPLLFEYISRNRAVVVFYNAGASFHTLWHFGVLTGYDLEKDKVYVHAGKEEHMRMNLTWFYERWSEGDHWAMAVSKVSDLPQSLELAQMIENLDVFINLEDLKTARELLKVLKLRFPQEKTLIPYSEMLGV